MVSERQAWGRVVFAVVDREEGGRVVSRSDSIEDAARIVGALEATARPAGHAERARKVSS